MIRLYKSTGKTPSKHFANRLPVSLDVNSGAGSHAMSEIHENRALQRMTCLRHVYLPRSTF